MLCSLSRFRLPLLLGAIAAAMISTAPVSAQTFADPTDGWAYTFEGQSAFASDEPFDSFDQTWDHDNSSDKWDGLPIGEGSPGGVSSLMEGEVDFLRVQDPGDPRDYDLDDPSNRRLYFTHLLGSDFDDDNRPDNLDTIVGDGVTLYFRARIATEITGPLDEMHPNGGDGIEPWPEEGIGYSQHNGGKSIIAIKESAGANVAFGLDYGREVNKDLFSDNGLVLQHRLFETDLAGVGFSEDEKDSDPDKDADEVRVNAEGHIVAVDDITDWQEFWVTIQEGELEEEGTFSGTHEVHVYHGGSDAPMEPHTFIITASTGEDYTDDFEDQSYIAIGAGATGAEGAYDVDFLSWKPGVHVPSLLSLGCTPTNALLGDFDGNETVEFADFLVLSSNFGNSVAQYDQGDADCNGEVNFADFLQLSANFGQTLGAAGASSVPEPASISMFALNAFLLMLYRQGTKNRSVALSS